MKDAEPRGSGSAADLHATAHMSTWQIAADHNSLLANTHHTPQSKEKVLQVAQGGKNKHKVWSTL